MERDTLETLHNLCPLMIYDCLQPITGGRKPPVAEGVSEFIIPKAVYNLSTPQRVITLENIAWVNLSSGYRVVGTLNNV